MSEQPPKPPWPSYLPLPQKDILAIGVIALNYCQLENIFQVLFSAVTRLNDFQTQALFHRLANNVRKDVLSELLAKTTIPDDLREAISYFLVGFGRCADNRHFIMHSSSGGIHRSQGKYGLVLQRYSRSGKTLVSYLTLKDLQRVADEIHDYTSWGVWVASDISSYATHLAAKHPENYRASLSTLRERPPPPVLLNWNSPPVSKGRGLPHAASHLISAYRVIDEDGQPQGLPDPPLSSD